MIIKLGAALSLQVHYLQLRGSVYQFRIRVPHDKDIRRVFKADFEETGRWPMGHRKIELIDKAVDRAEATLEKMTKIGGLSERTEVSATAPMSPVPPFDSKSQRKVEVMPGVFQYAPK